MYKRQGFGIALIEAQAAGLHCFVSDTITEESNLGLCEYYSLDSGAEMWAQKISHYMDNPEKKCIDEMKLRKVDIKETVKELEKYYG